MADSARVHSLAALEQFRSTWLDFGDQGVAALDLITAEIRRTQEWLQEQLERWKFEIRKCEEAVFLAKQELAKRKMMRFADRIPDTSEQEKALRKALARLELTDGFDLPSLLSETYSRLPRDATVIVLLSAVSDQTAIALGNLRRQGFAVSAILNLFDDYQFSQAAGRLLAQGIDSRHLKDEQSIVTICQRQLLHQ